MGHEARTREQAAAQKATLSTEPIPVGNGTFAPSPWLEQACVDMTGGCLADARQIKKLLEPDLSLGGRKEFNPMITLLQVQIQLLQTLAALTELLRTHLTGKPTMSPVPVKPVVPPSNGDEAPRHGQAVT